MALALAPGSANADEENLEEEKHRMAKIGKRLIILSLGQQG